MTVDISEQSDPDYPFSSDESIVRVGIISDTHGQFSPRIVEAFADVDLIVHAGDVGPQSILMRLENIAPDVIAVRGNNDYDLPLKLVEKAWVAGLTILVSHTPAHLRRALADERRTNSAPILAIHGHTHVPEFQRSDASTTLACPGSASQPRVPGGPTVMILQLSEGAVLSHELVRV